MSLASLVLVLLYVASPYWTLLRMRLAVENKDTAHLAAHMDFPQLRESLKVAFSAQLAEKAAAVNAEGFEALGAAFGAMLMGPIVDSLVTPETLISLMQGEDLEGMATGATPTNEPPASTRPSKPEMKVTRMKYEDMNRFVVKVSVPSDASAENESLTLVLARDGFFTWKLTRVLFPLD